MKTVIIIRFCEIHLKGKNRGYFERLLQSNIESSLKDINHNFTALHSRYVVDDFDINDYDLICDKLKKIPGVHTFSKGLVVDNDFELISEAVLEVCKGKTGTFKVAVNRADKTFPIRSMDACRELGGRVLDNYKDLTVNVSNPDHLINVDIREDGKTFIYCDVEYGISGMPVGSAGKGLLLISGGIDSPVAGYMMAKRGMKLDCVHFHSYPYTGEAAKEKVIELTKKVSEYNGGMNLYVVSFTKIQEAIHKYARDDYMITIMRRIMMRIAERLSKKIGAQAIITGESLGQVASQTIEGMTCTEEVLNMPILRPLVAFDKLDIIKISKDIDTYDTSILPYEDCCTVFLPKFPVIKPSIETAKQEEAKFDMESLIEEAIQNAEKYQF
ncbi:MAG: tRNA 4-thiouridine(8) synthase ThiI [Clostridia bacterium]|nr:tRNA 4-thiouridine(8) synthase ThiI [Clostridia bacterium]